MREREVNAASEDRKVCSFKDLGTLLPFFTANLFR